MSIYKLSTPIQENTESIITLLQMGLGISEVTARLLFNRDITGIDEARAFLNPSLDQLNDPFLLQDMDKAVKRIKEALSEGEKIVVYGDYDADGITSSSILSLYLRSLGGDVDVYIPSRQEEGYGLHLEALKSIKSRGAGLIITVDCGISAVEEVRRIKSEMDIIITDHHMPGPELPEAFAVINPKISGQAYPFTELAGVGVAAKLIQAMGDIKGLEPYLDLVAIGTIADIVPLEKENRVFAALGIRQINENPRPGIDALIQVLDLKEKGVDAGRISYSIGPCLNAPGRMSTFHTGYRLLTADNREQALPLAAELVEENLRRRETENQILEAADEVMSRQVDMARDRVLVIAGENWHPGVIGIVASRITEKYSRPSIVLSIEGGQAVGSARSIRGFHLFNALSACEGMLLRFGGHEMAAGLSIESSKIDDFRKQICAYADEVMEEEILIPQYFYDGQLDQSQITPALLDEIDMLAPFGFGNPNPKFLLPSAVVETSRLVGRESEHLKLALSFGRRSWDAIGFGMAEAAKNLHQGSRVSLLTSLKRSEWMGICSTQFQIHSVKPIYQSRQDLEDLLSSFYFKLFDVFLQDFMYNDIRTNLTANKEEKFPVSHDLLTLEEAACRLEEAMVGTAVFISSYEAAKAVLEHLMEKDLLDRIPVEYHYPYLGNGLGRNSVILIPEYGRRPEANYHTIITPQMEDKLHISLKGFTSARKNRKHCRFIPDNGEDRKKLNTDGVDLNREQLGIIYKWLRKLVPGRNIWADGRQLLKDLQEGTGCLWTGFQLRLALEIFRELNFITVQSGNQTLKICCAKNPESRQLNESRLVNYHRQWLKSYGIGVSTNNA
jgi:single-stranded-DNA-specific exonuclease